MGTPERCDILPEPLPEKGTLYISPPTAPTTASICGFLRRSKIPFTQPYPDIYEIRLAPGTLVRMVAEHFSELSQPELNDTKCLVVPEGEKPTVQDLVRMQPLSSLLARIEGQWLLELLKEDRLRTVFQPVVECANPASLYGYECLIRGVSAGGEFIQPTEMFRLAEAADLLFHLDRLTRLSVIRDAIKSAINVHLFINFVPSAIYVPAHCLQTTVTAINQAGIPNDHVVFEVVESEHVRDFGHLMNILDFYRSHGFRVALDDLGAGNSSLKMLYRMRPDFIKIDTELVHDVDKDTYKARIAGNVLALSQELGIMSIAEGVERVGEWAWLRERHTDYVQGFLFGKPNVSPAAPKTPA